MVSKLVFAVAAAQCVSAHFGISYPAWRADTLTKDTNYSQWTYPCAGVPYGVGNVTEWPLEGAAIKLDLHHTWTYVFVNLGFGENVTNFNVSLTPQFLNATGKGTLCLDKLPLPAGLEDGSLATVQVVTVGNKGSALYNCADVRFKKDAKPVADCNSGNISVVKIQQQTGNATATNATAGSRQAVDSAAGLVNVDTLALGSVVGLASAFVLGLSL
ncbi:hypothetical protein DCS_04489 [Drechmeria coniospora]|uniref:Copper acquisition factor BIM1-like domain-containing protein n=1 Tax=Drechmeria coniospora TaxID=98403 RepID=A0A151GK59_DRECN|nr:hypothetical protein DCS_04489 [Drechmeria coniospora]KYK57479.1 hypothetical protein DCS_04489 [Drechmeria coniospora]ODA79386.1 hypothetical protein RJ55_04979 [Drechmeria coniospora]